MKKLTEAECLEIGGHCWDEYNANDCVDEFGLLTGIKHLLYYPNGEPRFRTCKHCGKTQRLIQEWEDTK